jgi:hypothetical protein
MGRVFATLVAAGVVAAAASAGSESGAVVGPSKIRITSTETKYVRLDDGRAGRGTGDTEIVTQQLFNRRVRQKPIGRAELVCTFTFGSSRSCRGTYFLPRGKLVVAGSILYRELYELAVVGGTGLYDNARGTLTVTRRPGSPRNEIVVFRLVG